MGNLSYRFVRTGGLIRNMRTFTNSSLRKGEEKKVTVYRLYWLLHEIRITKCDWTHESGCMGCRSD